MKNSLAILFTLFSVSAISAELPPRWRFEYNYGKVNSSYFETQDSILFEDVEIEQTSDYHQFVWQYYLVPPWVDFSIGASTTGSQIEEPKDEAEQFRYISVFGNIGIVLPISDFWNFKLLAESFYTSMQVKDDAFGFQNLRGNQVYPEVEWLPFGSDMFLQISPYFKFPLWTDTGGRKETTIGLKLQVPIGSNKKQRFPTFAYQKAIMIKIFYTNMSLKFERSGFIESEITVRQVGATVGFNF